MHVCGVSSVYGSTFRLVQLLKGDPVPSATMYTIGNIIAISATCFYMSWHKQNKCLQTRFVTTCIYFALMGFTLYLAFYGDNISGRGFLLVLCIIMQFCALTWYTLSFIPWARGW